MAYLPGVPDMEPSPVSPTPGGAKTTIGKPQGIAARAESVGKPGRVEHLGSVVGRRGAGISSIGGGDTPMHSANHYGKRTPDHLKLLGGDETPGGVDPTAHPGTSMIRGGSGSMRRHILFGGLGPGRRGAPGKPDTGSDSTMSGVDL